ncbi:Poly A polymerase, head domain [Syntrophomonas zehnderi OL-4]|uniref:Poly A polymerase, head domain n=1 Tax=Syntrophomonas zehnderi OL-4 TaxID=690567 RepID=A0A0E3W319_9FIRM|nr:HD domain-containing protein [Syntrophomonas zehnderi]CFX41072.1 Poly A polymerase, head domain [Syntrophomonas zehnderi OL-4]
MQIEIPINVKLIMDTLQTEGYQAFIYGACIRDTLLGLKPIKWDITTNALPSDIVALFDDHQGFSAIPAIRDYSTVSLIYQGESYNVSTFRTGTEHRFSNDIAEEVRQNDFTMNTLAYNDQAGLVDLLNGVNDIENKLIKCARDPAHSIKEDTVRILRAIRFESQFGFTMDDELIEAIRSFNDPEAFKNSEKVSNELTQILLTDRPSLAIRRMLELGLLEQIIPELIPAIGFDTHSSFHDKDVFEHTLVVLDHCKPNLTLRLAALFHDIDKPGCLTIDEFGEGHCYGHAVGGSKTAREVLTRLNFDSKTISAVCVLIREHMNSYENVTELSIKRLIRRVGPSNVDNLFELQLADIKGSELSGRDVARITSVRNRCWEVISRKEPLTTHDLDISGYDLMPLYPTGKEIGEALEYLLDKVVENPTLNKKEHLLALLKTR